MPRAVRARTRRRSPAELAVVVISLRGELGLVDAVRSLLDQDPKPEVVVVNSGGGDPETTLAKAVVDVTVIEHPSPVFPGTARNLGVRATRAPFVAFLAADCRAEPGWVAERLRMHRQGAGAVASVMTNGAPGSATAQATHLLAYSRRMASTPAPERALYGLSYARTLLERHGPFREDLRQGEDTELNRRLAPSTEVVWAPEVRTAHRNPVRPRQLLRDQYDRGRRSILFTHLPLRATLRIALVKRPLDSFRRGLRAQDGAKLRTGRVVPLLAAASLAYAAGIMRSRARLTPSPAGAEAGGRR
jgi:glycosyltransferase involved in cell wall biosynthesis